MILNDAVQRTTAQLRKSLPGSWILVTVLALLAGSPGCGHRQTDPRTLNLVLKNSPNRLDPAFVVGAAEGEICTLIFEGLVRFDAAGKLVSGVAASWEVNGEGTRYRFHLDPRVRFSNGRRVTSADVAYSFRRVLSPQSGSPRQWVLDPIRGARAFTRGDEPEVVGLIVPNDSTVVLELTQPFKPFLSMLALPAAMVVAEESVGEASGGVPVGCGPWRLDDWKRADFIALAPNAHHPRASHTLDHIRFRIIPEAFTRVAEFESGALDVLELPPAEVPRFLEDDRYQGLIQSRAELRVYYIGLNNRDPRFTDVRVRRALNMAVNVDQLIRVLANGEAVRAAGSIPPGLPGYVKRAPYPYDPARARQLLSEAGYPEGFEMEIWQRESPQGNRVLEAVQGYLAESGITVRLVRREWSAFKEAVAKGKVDAFYLDWLADYPDGENFLFPLFHSSNLGGGGNRAFYINARVDSLIERASATVDDATSARLYAAADSLIHSDAPWIYLYFPRSFHAVSPAVSGYRLPSLYLGGDYTTVSKSY